MTQNSSERKSPESVFIVGCGNIGRRVAAIMHKNGATVSALSRTPETKKTLETADINVLPADLDRPESLHDLPLGGQKLFYFAPPPAKGEVDIRMGHFLAAILPSALPEKVVYISTSGVYGDCGGEWVDESTIPHPQTARAHRRLDAENRLRQWGVSHNVPVVILRVGGIYSEDSLPVEKIRAGTPLVDEAECGYINRIHAYDLAKICIAAMERGKADNIYNVSDGKPGTMTQYFLAVADALDIPRPPIITMEEARTRLSPAMLSYLQESRRLDTKKMLDELGVSLSYPDLESGLKGVRENHRDD